MATTFTYSSEFGKALASDLFNMRNNRSVLMPKTKSIDPGIIHFYLSHHTLSLIIHIVGTIDSLVIAKDCSTTLWSHFSWSTGRIRNHVISMQKLYKKRLTVKKSQQNRIILYDWHWSWIYSCCSVFMLIWLTYIESISSLIY